MKTASNNIPIPIMRNNAHFTSAILHNDIGEACAHNFLMKSERDIFLDLVRGQCAYIDLVINKKGLRSTTELAECIKVSPSTINRFYNADEPKNALTARTIAKIEDFSGIPFTQSQAQSNNGVFSALKVIILALIKKQEISKDEFELLFNSHLRKANREGRPDEAAVMDQLLEFLHSEFSSSTHKDQRQSQPQAAGQSKKEKNSTN